MTIKVSVVVPTYKRPVLLNRCLGALVAQDFDPFAYEVIVVDDAAQKETRRLVENWAACAETYALVPASAMLVPEAAGLPGEASDSSMYIQSSLVPVSAAARLRYLPTRGNCGPAAARNIGWRAASGEIIAFTDDDCIPDRNWLKKGLEAFREGVKGVSGRVIVPLPPRPTDYERNVARLEASQFVTANCFYQVSALWEMGGFDERFTIAWREDSDLFFRLLERSYFLADAPEAVVVHPVRPAPWGISLTQQRKSQFNALVYKKHPKLYRQKLQSNPPLNYYAIILALLIALWAVLAKDQQVALASMSIWTGLTLHLSAQRLRHTAHTLSHITEMFVTSALIPPLSIYWRLRGAFKYRVLFL